jgi:hypothetical protein
VSSQHLPEIPGDGLVDGLKIDDLIALQHAEMPTSISFEPYNFHDDTFNLMRTNYAARPSKHALSMSRAANPATRLQAFTIASRKPPGGMACPCGSFSS